MNQENKTAKIFFWIALVLTAIQFVLPQAPNYDPTLPVFVWTSGILLLGINVTTIFKQYFSTKVDNNAITISIVMLGISIIGAILDALKTLPLEPVAAQWARFILSSVHFALNFFSKQIWPSQEQKTENFQKAISKREL